MTEYVRVPRDGPDIIWLEPSCCADPSHGRQWCEDDAFPVCEDGHEPVKYIRADLAASPQEAVPTKREAALADLAKLDGETMDLAASPQGEGSSAHPAPIKPSSDTGELRERVTQIIEAAIERHNPGNAVRHTLDDADEILNLIQSERAG